MRFRCSRVTRIPSASGLSNFTRITASSFATSIVTTFWDRHSTLHQTHLAEATSVYDPRLQQAIDALGIRGYDETQALGAITRTLSNQAHLLSTLDFFWICGWVSFVMIVVVWFARRPSGGAPTAAAE